MSSHAASLWLTKCLLLLIGRWGLHNIVLALLSVVSGFWKMVDEKEVAFKQHFFNHLLYRNQYIISDGLFFYLGTHISFELYNCFP